MRKNIFIIIVFFVLVLSAVGYKSIGYNSSFSDKFSNLLPENLRKFLLNSVFIVPNLKNKLKVSQNKNQEKKDEIFVKDYHFFYEYIIDKDINFNFLESKNLNFKNQNFTLTKFKSEQNFLPKYHNRYSKSSLYIDVLTSENVLFIVTGSGVIMKSNLDNFIYNKNTNINSKLIDSNLNEIIKYKQFYENSKFGIKDIMIDSNYLYVSFTNSPFKDCYNISVYKAKILKNIEKLIFKKVFDPEECVQVENDYGEFEAYHSGGRISKYDNNSFFLSIGEFRYRDLAQDTKSIFGKILKFNETKNEFEVIAMGTRNVQGLVYDPKLDSIVFTEHGPLGGDEININKSIGNEIENYGWPIASYGEHYPPDLEKKYSKAPLKKSHEDNGFLEPLSYYVPAIGICPIVKYSKNEYLIGSLGSKIEEGDFSLHRFKIDDKFKIIDNEIIPIGERIRDIFVVNENMLILSLENSVSIGVMIKN